MIDVVIPKMGMTTREVDLLKWHVAVGTSVEPGTPLADIDSEKATLTIEAEVRGRVVELLVPEGDITEVGATICRIEEEA